MERVLIVSKKEGKILRIEGIPEETFRQIKIAAASKGLSMKEWVLDAINDQLIMDGKVGSNRARKEQKK
jgi:hypothetical protein